MILLQTALLLLLYGEGWGYRILMRRPTTWRLGVPESVYIEMPPQSESFPVKLSLMSHPDQMTGFSSALLRLTPENRFRGSVGLWITAEDSPGEFVDLVVESGAFRNQITIPVTGTTLRPRNQPGRLKRRRRQSLLSSHDIHIMKNRYSHPRLQQCCLNGSNYYSGGEDCKNGLQEMFKKAKEACRLAAEECCHYTKDRMVKDMPIAIRNPRPPTDTVRDREQVADTGRDLKEQITITVIQSRGRGTVTSTFTVKVDPTKDVSIEVSSKSFSSKVDIALSNPPPADED